MNNNTLLIVGVGLIVIGLTKPNLNNLKPNIVSSGKVSVTTPLDPSLKKEAEDVVSALSRSSISSKEAADLRDLYIGLASLIKLDGEDKLVSSTDNIRQANSVGGRLLHLDLKGKCPEVVKESNDLVTKTIGDDNVSLTGELRNKAYDAFMALAWAYNQAR